MQDILHAGKKRTRCRVFCAICKIAMHHMQDCVDAAVKRVCCRVFAPYARLLCAICKIALMQQRKGCVAVFHT